MGDAVHHLRSPALQAARAGRDSTGQRRHGALHRQETFFLQSICDYAAIAIENARSVEKIQELTITDDCTGLYNARHLYKTLETEVYRSARFGYEFTVLFIDLDHFKTGQRHARTSDRKQAADGDWIPDQSAAAID